MSRVPELSYTDGLALAQTLTPQQRACRLAGAHRYPEVDSIDALWLDVKRWKYYQVFLECDRGCGVRRDVQVDYDGFIIGTPKMDYSDAEGYLLKGSWLGTDARAALRRDAIERRGAVASTEKKAPRGAKINRPAVKRRKRA